MPQTQDHVSRLLELGRQEEPRAILGLPCPACRRDLMLSGFQKSFLLICSCGYQVKPKDASGFDPEHARALRAVLRVWEQRLVSLRALCHDARVNGFEAFSAVMERHVHNLHSRIEHLRRLTEPPSGRYVPPKAI